MICTIVLFRILPERNVTLMFFRERKYAAEPTAKQGGLCAAQSPPWTLWILDLFKLKREDRIGKVTNFRATMFGIFHRAANSPVDPAPKLAPVGAEREGLVSNLYFSKF